MIIGDYMNAFLTLLFVTLGLVVAGYVAALCVRISSRRKPGRASLPVTVQDELKAA